MNKETMQMKLTYWTGIIKEAKASGMKIEKWCEMNQITKRQYYYWHKKVMHDTYELATESGLLPDIGIKPSNKDLPAAPEFAELTVPDTDFAHELNRDTDISIKWNDFTITIGPKFSEGELAKILRVMQNV